MIYICSTRYGNNHIFYDSAVKKFIRVRYDKPHFTNKSLFYVHYNDDADIELLETFSEAVFTIKNKEYCIMDTFNEDIGQAILLSKIVENFK